jgi:plasmid replication initiation protein
MKLVAQFSFLQYDSGMDSVPRLRTLELTPRDREALKPIELVRVTGHQTLTLFARRTITILWHNAHQQGVEPGKDYTIEIDDLNPDRHKGYEMVEDAIKNLMTTILTVKLANGATRRVQFLGGNDLDDPERPGGVLTYSFDKRLIDILQNSTIWGKISIPVIMAFTSKYAVSLYENIAQMVNLAHKTSHIYSLDEFRELMGVQKGCYKTFGELNKYVLKPAVMEINALAAFGLSALPVKEGKRVVQIHVGWWQKDLDALQLAQTELQATKVGRRARIAGTVIETVSPPEQSIRRLTRTDRAEWARKKAAPKSS